MAEYDTAYNITHVCSHFERDDTIAQGKRLTSIFKITVKNKQTTTTKELAWFSWTRGCYAERATLLIRSPLP